MKKPCLCANCSYIENTKFRSFCKVRSVARQTHFITQCPSLIILTQMLPPTVNPYIQENFQHLLALSSAHPPFNYLQTTQHGRLTASQREALVDWVFEVSEDLQLATKSAELAVSYIDEFLSRKPLIQLKVLELVGSISLVFGVGFEENNIVTPSQVLEMCTTPFTKDNVVTLQAFILKTLGYDLYLATACDFLNSLFEFVHVNWKIRAKADAFVKYCCKDFQSTLKGPLVKALACAYCAFDYPEEAETWLSALQEFIEFNINSVHECVERVRCEEDSTSSEDSVI